MTPPTLKNSGIENSHAWRVALAMMALLPGSFRSEAMAADRIDISAWRLEAGGKGWKVEGRFDGGEDLSGGAAMGGNHGFVVSDETRAVQAIVIDSANGKVKSSLSTDLSNETGSEFDLEGIAAAPAESCYYATGSHGVSRKKGTVEPDRSLVFQIPVDATSGRVPEGGVARSSLRPSLKADPVLSAALDKPVSGGGLDIEGIAWKEGALYFGLRAPLPEEASMVVEVDAAALFRAGEKTELKRHSLSLGKGAGVSDIASIREGFLVLSGPSQSEEDRPGGEGLSRLHYWAGPGSNPIPLGEITPPRSGKAEAIMVLRDDEAAIELLVFHDGVKNGAPTPWRIKKQGER